MLRRVWALGVRLTLIAACGGFASGGLLLAGRFRLIALVFLVAAALGRLRGRPQSAESHGSARVATHQEIARRGMLDGEGGLIFGRPFSEPPPRMQAAAGLLLPWVGSEEAVNQFTAAWFGGKRYLNRLLRVKDFTHILTVAPAGSGKGVGSVILNLLAYRGNTLTFDPKGENYAATARHRQAVFGQRIIRLDPTGVHGTGDSYNPLDSIDPARGDFLETCRDVAAMLVIRTGKEPDNHWLDSCEIVCMSIIAFICSCVVDPEKRNFKTFRLIVSSPENYQEAITVMKERPECQGIFTLLANQLRWYQGKELNSVLTTVNRMTGFLDSPLIAANTARTSFPPRILKTGQADAYLIVPPPMMNSMAPLIRLWLGCLTRTFTQDDPSERKKLLLIVDEAAVLGRMKVIEEGITLMRGFGLRIWLIFQSLDQLRVCYGENAQTVLDNLGTQHYFGISSYETAKSLSERIGDATILIKTLNLTTGRSYPLGGGPDRHGSHNSSTSTTYAPHGRRLLQPNEILNMPDWMGMLFHKNMHMIPNRQVRYYSAHEFSVRRPGTSIRGTGRMAGLGLMAAVQAAVVLLAGLGFAAAMAALPPFEPDRPQPRYAPAYGPEPYPLPDGISREFITPALPPLRHTRRYGR